MGVPDLCRFLGHRQNSQVHGSLLVPHGWCAWIGVGIRMGFGHWIFQEPVSQAAALLLGYSELAPV
ncbi:hypothetical protein LEMLEM_LOCUS7570 [Lemmus lemmus]